MAVAPPIAEITRRVLAEPGDPEALAALLWADLPYPLGEVMWFGQKPPAPDAGDWSSRSGPVAVFYTVIEDGRDRLEMAPPVGAFLAIALGAVMREEGWSEDLAALRSAAAELAAVGDADDTLAGWAMEALLRESGVARVYRPAVTGARP